MKTHDLSYFGELSGLVVDEKSICFVTAHQEGKPTALYKIDAETNKLSQVDLDFVPVALHLGSDCFWIAGKENTLASVTRAGSKITKHKVELPSAIVAMVTLADSRIALLCKSVLLILEAKTKGKLLQTIELSEEGTAIAAHPDGRWLAVGGEEGLVSVFQCEEQTELVLSEAEKIHSAKVTAILFEQDELRFFSAGKDHKLMSTHARGRLEPEDRGRSNMHDKSIMSLVHANEDRFVSGSLDKSCKSWTRKGATKPQTQAEGLVAVQQLATVDVHGRRNLVVACEDNSLRLFLLDEEGRIGNSLTRYNDVYSRAKKLFQSKEVAERGDAMQTLAAIGDRESVELLAERVPADSDNQLRLTAAKLLSKSNHPQLADLLAKNLSHPDSPVRIHVLEALEDVHPNVFELYPTVLKVDHADVGVHSIESLVKFASGKSATETEKNKAKSLLIASLDHNLVEVRNAAIFGLERLFDKKSPRPNLMTLESKSPDAKRKGLIRLLQRSLLADPNAEAGLRRSVEDKSPEVRQAAFLISVLSRPELAKTLRKKDKDFDRQLKEIENFDFEASVGAKAKKKTTKKKKR